MVESSDLRIVLSQSPSAERIQHVQQQHSDLSQRQFSLHVQDLHERRRREVSGSEEAEGRRVEEDPDQTGERQKEEDGEGSGPREETRGDESPAGGMKGPGRIIDIRI